MAKTPAPVEKRPAPSQADGGREQRPEDAKSKRLDQANLEFQDRVVGDVLRSEGIKRGGTACGTAPSDLLAEWYVAKEGRRAGPLTYEELGRFASGPIPTNLYVWRDGFERWVPLADLRGLFPRSDPALRVIDDCSDIQSATTSSYGAQTRMLIRAAVGRRKRRYLWPLALAAFGLVSLSAHLLLGEKEPVKKPVVDPVVITPKADPPRMIELEEVRILEGAEPKKRKRKKRARSYHAPMPMEPPAVSLPPIPIAAPQISGKVVRNVISGARLERCLSRRMVGSRPTKILVTVSPAGSVSTKVLSGRSSTSRCLMRKMKHLRFPSQGAPTKIHVFINPATGLIKPELR